MQSKQGRLLHEFGPEQVSGRAWNRDELGKFHILSDSNKTSYKSRIDSFRLFQRQRWQSNTIETCISCICAWRNNEKHINIISIHKLDLRFLAASPSWFKRTSVSHRFTLHLSASGFQEAWEEPAAYTLLNRCMCFFLAIFTVLPYHSSRKWLLFWARPPVQNGAMSTAFRPQVVKRELGDVLSTRERVSLARFICGQGMAVLWCSGVSHVFSRESM
jgi:hypothetical protein